ncbi:MAG TPA: DUF6311 domain-containing protein [Anaerolineaceae bacterium]|nr:DUF6311 domain-containing protein [Anaerolineaceae bacterium]HPN51834.1 DUF6311 domain-containing protein [Anaerolineaceae bacterium]
MPASPRFQISPRIRHAAVLLALSLVLGLAWYLLLYGRYPLYPSHVNWLYNARGDVLQHQLGWEWFRQEPWRFPLGSIQAYGYPFGTSVAFMDAIPLLAIPFKLLSPWLEPNFQYYGFWELASLIGQVLFGLLILSEFTRSWAVKILGASLLAISAPMIFRAFYHSSLSAQWLLLAGIWFALLEYRGRLWRGAWILLFALAMLIHVYFIPMLAPLWLIGLFFHYKKEKRRWPLLLELLAAAAVVLGIGYSLGIFSLSYQSLQGSGFGFFSWNLDGFFNPFHFASAFVQGLGTGTDGQFEGFSYLGLGGFLILPPAIYLFFEKEVSRRRLGFLWPFGLAALGLMLFALSNRAFLGNFPLWDLELPDALLGFCNLFRTSGRFILPVFYFIMVGGLAVLARNLRHPAPVLLAAVLLQLVDLRPLYTAKTPTGFTRYESGLLMEFWEPAAQTNAHIVIIPAKKLTSEYEPLAIFAAHNRLTLNLGYFARSDVQAFQSYAQETWAQLKAGQADDRTIYVLSDPEWIAFAKSNLTRSLYFCELDEFAILFSADNAVAQTDFNAPLYCSIPSR